MTSRQDREVAYHKLHAEKLRTELAPTSYEVLRSRRRRWWNAYWSMYDVLLAQDLRGKTALVVGCGAGTDAIYLAKLGARVHAFDLSPEMIALAEHQAERESVEIDFRIMSAEDLLYAADTFDLVLVRDILHHCELPKALGELIRVARGGSLFVVDELYTHSWLQSCRESLLGKWLQLKLIPVIYNHREPYITEDERKLDQDQLHLLRGALTAEGCAYFNMVVTRFLPDRWALAARVDRLVLRTLGRWGYLFAGRFLLWGHIAKPYPPATAPVPLF